MPKRSSATKSKSYANFSQRFLAVLIDGFILMAIQWILQRTLGLVMTRMWYLNTFISWGYAVYFIGSTGQTLGKKVMSIKVVKANGSRLTYGDAVLREVLGKFASVFTLGIGFLWMLWDDKKQTLHDKIASTVVVNS